MGNNGGKIQASVKEQADNKAFKVYKYVDALGGGELVALAKECRRLKDYTKLEESIRTNIKPFLYNNGNGKLVHVSELVKWRSKSAKPPLARSSNKKKTNNVYPMLDIIQAGDNELYLPNKIDPDFREVCWDIDQRGAVGETALLLCFLNATSIHLDLAKRLIGIFPKMINDVYLSDEYYGENSLHLAITNEDSVMVKFLLDHGCNIHQRAFGNFLTPEDQKASRTSYLDDEFIEVCVNTDYEGYVYWGEYPLNFAVCCCQEESLRLLLSRGADPNLQDMNGNTVLHIIVIQSSKMNLKMLLKFFVILVNKGARLDIKNNQGLTPLTLAAKLGRKEIHTHILLLERETRWHYGNTVCVAHPLTELDTVLPNGSTNKDSALMYIVFGTKLEHLRMLDNVVLRLLERKWETYVRRRFYTMFMFFIVYFAFFLIAFCLRPGKDRYPINVTENLTIANGSIITLSRSISDACYLLRASTWDEIARLVCEAVIVVMATINLILVSREIYYQGIQVFLLIMSSAPMRCMYVISCIFIVLMVPCRATCSYVVEDYFGVFAILITAPYFLFFCRGFKMVGPFVLMLYKMVTGDLMRFASIYVIFICGFSQSMFIVFRRVDDSIFHSAGNALMGMFIMSLGEFAEIYEQFDCSNHATVGKMLFMIYMIIVTLLLVNMLIAMMGHTFEAVNRTGMEWLRQWARIVLVVEQTFSREERLFHQSCYSQQMQDGRKALVVRWKTDESDEDSDIFHLKKRRVISADERLAEDSQLQQELSGTSGFKLMQDAMNKTSIGSVMKVIQEHPSEADTDDADVSVPVQC